MLSFNLIFSTFSLVGCEEAPATSAARSAASVVASSSEECHSCAFVTRTQGFWKNHPCVIDGDATGSPLVPLTLGASLTFTTSDAIVAYLRTPPRGDAQIILGHQLVAAKLNAAAFRTGEEEVADWDNDGVSETFNALLAIADVLFDTGSRSEQTAMADVLDALNNSGDGEALYFDSRCEAPPELCDQEDNDGDGEIDEACPCGQGVELCDGVDLDGDGTIDELGPDNDRDGFRDEGCTYESNVPPTWVDQACDEISCRGPDDGGHRGFCGSWPGLSSSGCTRDEWSLWCKRRSRTVRIECEDGASIDLNPDWVNFHVAEVQARCSGEISFTCGGGKLHVLCYDAVNCVNWDCKTPLVLVREGASVSYHASDRFFDLGGMAHYERTDWPGPQTPWLVFDANNNGRIDDGSELIGPNSALNGAGATDGVLVLAGHDDDGDGWLTPMDALWARLSVWTDANMDRATNPGELISLDDFGALALGLRAADAPACDARGNCARQIAPMRYRDAQGSVREGQVVDIHLAPVANDALATSEQL